MAGTPSQLAGSWAGSLWGLALGVRDLAGVWGPTNPPTKLRPAGGVPGQECVGAVRGCPGYLGRGWMG